MKCKGLPGGFPRADMGAAVVELKGMIRRAKAAYMDVAQSRIRELTDAAQYRRKMDAEIASATANCELKLDEERQRRERLERDMRESGPSAAAEPPRPRQNAGAPWIEQNEPRCVPSNARPHCVTQKRYSHIKVEHKTLPYRGSAFRKKLDEYGIKRAENVMTIGSYITVRRRLVIRNHTDLPRSTGKKPKERCMLTSIARFWLCNVHSPLEASPKAQRR